MIWCLDENDDVRELVVYTLEQSGYKAQGYKNEGKMFEQFKKETPEMIILDIQLSTMDGLELIKNIRAKQKYRMLPIIIITQKGSESEKIEGLNAGADDYILKPFGIMELVARVKAVLRRFADMDKSDEKVVGDIYMKEEAHCVYVNNKIIELTYNEYEILKLFMKHPEEVLSKDELIKNLLGNKRTIEPRTVGVYITALRHKLGDAGGQLKTVVGVGYKLVSST